jgi:hypothetical protein
MTNFSVEGLLAHRSFKAGMAGAVIQRDDQSRPSPAPQSMGSDAGVKVVLSPAASKISLLLKSESAGKASAAVGFDEFLESNHQQIKAHGKNADFLKEVPQDLSPERQILAQQAALSSRQSLRRRETPSQPLCGKSVRLTGPGHAFKDLLR